MAQLFKPGANTLATLSLYIGAAVPFLAIVIGSQITRSPANTKVDVPLNQPVPFSHIHHVKELGIDCRFCHGSVEKGAVAGVPSTEVCMTCHSQVWTNSPNLEPLRASLATNTPLQWNKVNKLPDFVYFNHSIHVQRGVSCNNCHGAVQNMPITSKGRAFWMSWCLECHNNPEKFLHDGGDPHMKPVDQVFALYRKIANGEKLTVVEQELADGAEQRVPADKVHEGLKLVRERGIKTAQLTDCWTCHR